LKLTEEDVMKSEMVMAPLRFLHICPTSVAACATIVASKDKARKITNKPIWVKDYACYHSGLQPRLGEPWLCAGIAFPTGTQFRWGVEQCAIKLYKRNGITNPRKELDLIESYSPSTWHEVDYYEAVKICGPGEAWKLIEQEATWPHGDIPVDPGGGVVSTNAIGASGQQRMAEAALQIRGDSGSGFESDNRLARPGALLSLWSLHRPYRATVYYRGVDSGAGLPAKDGQGAAPRQCSV
jgi:acetyl-CoA C-acetyltransferase